MNVDQAINLRSSVAELGESTVHSVLDAYRCPLNPDIEDFLRYKAFDFSKQSIAQTHLVMERDLSGAGKFAGFFTLTNKILDVPRENVSKTLARKIVRHGIYDQQRDSHFVATPLIAQLGHNYAEGAGCISVSKLLDIACRKVRAIQHELGSKLVYLNCEDAPALRSFNERNGFRRVTPNYDDGLVKYLRAL